MKIRTIGEIEAEITKLITKFQLDNVGKGPDNVKSYIVEDMIVMRMKGILTIIEKHLIKTSEGLELVKRCRICLIERSREILDKFLGDLLNVKVISFCRDVNVEMEDMFIVIGLNKNIEEKFQKRKK
ncbi:DUF2294 domain-containing protein [candidate division WOR-3 bacterium]|nr:DUF2294 domain-containing protein [candidate division WOR-3 bacterium]